MAGGGLIALPMLGGPEGGDGRLGAPVSSARATLIAALPSAAPAPSARLSASTPQPTPFRPPNSTPTVPAISEPDLTPTPQSTEPPPSPVPAATVAPTPAPRPPAQAVSLTIDDGSFTGGYDGPGSRRYQGRSVSWVYGSGTAFNTMTVKVRLRRTGEFGRRASLELVGLDGGDEGKSRMAIVLNGELIYRGRNPLADDQCCDGAASVEWGSAVFRFPGELLRRNNELSIINLDPADCTRCPTFVMLDYAELNYRVRPAP